MLKEIIVCADDFAQNESISEGVLQLTHQNRVNAIGCMVNCPFWHVYGQELKLLRDTRLIGLHFNLTYGDPLSTSWKKSQHMSFKSLPSLLMRSHLRQLNQNHVEQEFEAQLDAFEQVIGKLPDFIDGHQHIHQLPVIRDALLSVYKKRGLTCFFRKTSNGFSDLISKNQFPKSQLIALLGGLTFRKQLKKSAIEGNQHFSGIYNFNHASHYATYFRAFLAQARYGELIMCHPGLKSNDTTDPLCLFRHYEFNYFMSDDFLRDLVDNSCQLLKVSV